MFAQEMLYQRVQNIFSRTSCIAILWFDDRILEEIYETYYVRMYRNWDRTIMRLCHCVKNIRIRSYSGPYFPPFGLNTERERERYVSLRTQFKCGKIRTYKYRRFLRRVLWAVFSVSSTHIWKDPTITQYDIGYFIFII